jgi:hypothetical protein
VNPRSGLFQITIRTNAPKGFSFFVLSPNSTSWENSIIYGFQDFEESSEPFNFFMYKGGKSLSTSDTFVKNRTEMIHTRVVGSVTLSVADPTFISNGISQVFFLKKKIFIGVLISIEH